VSDAPRDTESGDCGTITDAVRLARKVTMRSTAAVSARAPVDTCRRARCMWLPAAPTPLTSALHVHPDGRQRRKPKRTDALLVGSVDATSV
jgi:hypothetical protein